MHELPVTESILRIVLDHAGRNGVQRVVRVHLRIGELSNLEAPWIQRYFDRLSADTIAEGALIDVESIPVKLRCSECGTEFGADVRAPGSIPCPSCEATTVRIVSGEEYLVDSIEAV